MTTAIIILAVALAFNIYSHYSLVKQLNEVLLLIELRIIVLEHPEPHTGKKDNRTDGHRGH